MPLPHPGEAQMGGPKEKGGMLHLGLHKKSPFRGKQKTGRVKSVAGEEFFTGCLPSMGMRQERLLKTKPRAWVCPWQSDQEKLIFRLPTGGAPMQLV
jgi:hypothetical protein